ncbi:MAG: hypothetical protein Sapg2KO_50890 [Saprospiraceae bacterium]
MKKTLLLFSVLSILSCEKMDMDEPGNLVPKTVDLDGLLPYIQVNGTKLHAEAFGDITKPILIFVPGGPGTDYCAFINRQGTEKQSRYPNLRTQHNLGLDQLQDEYYCVFFEPRGAGLSPRFDRNTLTINQYHNDLNAIIDHYLVKKQNVTGLPHEKVVLAGHSFGGLYVTSFVNKYPDRVKDVVLFEPTPLSKDVFDVLIQTSVFSMLNEEWLNEYLYSLEHLSYDDHARADYHRLLGFSGSFPELEYPENVPLWRYGTYANIDLSEDTFLKDDYDVTSNLDLFEGRALFIKGGKTRALDEDGWDLQISYYKNHQSKTVPNTGHYMLWENPDFTSQLIRKFLQ